jgi:pyruvate dehydrogenase E1 component beta subunit
MAMLTMREALNQAMKEEMSRDPSVFLLGEEVGAYQGAYKITQGLLAQFGEWRVRDRRSRGSPWARPSPASVPSRR